MASAEELKRRFDGVMSRLQAIHSELNLQQEDGTVVVDLGDLDSKCSRYQEQVDQLLQLPVTPEVNDQLAKLLIALSVSIEDLRMCCSDLKEPLDRMVSAVYERLPDDPDYADDAS